MIGDRNNTITIILTQKFKIFMENCCNILRSINFFNFYLVQNFKKYRGNVESNQISHYFNE